MAQLMDSIGEVSRAIAERKKKRDYDAIAAEMARRIPEFEGVDTADELKLAMQVQDWQAQRKYREALTDKVSRAPQSRGGGAGGSRYVDTEYGPMTPAQYASMIDRRAREQRLITAPPKPRRDDPVAKIERELNEKLIAAGGVTLQDVPNLRNQRLINPDGTPYNEEDAGLSEPLFAADLPQPSDTSRTIKVPREQFDTLRNQYDGLARLREQSQRDDGTSKAAQIYMQQARPAVTGQVDTSQGVIVQDAEGKRYRVSPEKAAAAEAAGYTRVR